MARFVRTKRGGLRRVTTPAERKVKVIKRGKVVASSQNLEVILRYQRQHSSIKSVSQKGYWLHVTYDDGAKCKVKFASDTLLTKWINSKRIRGVFP